MKNYIGTLTEEMQSHHTSLQVNKWRQEENAKTQKEKNHLKHIKNEHKQKLIQAGYNPNKRLNLNPIKLT